MDLRALVNSTQASPIVTPRERITAENGQVNEPPSGQPPVSQTHLPQAPAATTTAMPTSAAPIAPAQSTITASTHQTIAEADLKHPPSTSSVPTVTVGMPMPAGFPHGTMQPFPHPSIPGAVVIPHYPGQSPQGMMMPFMYPPARPNDAQSGGKATDPKNTGYPAPGYFLAPPSGDPSKFRPIAIPMPGPFPHGAPYFQPNVSGQPMLMTAAPSSVSPNKSGPPGPYAAYFPPGATLMPYPAFPPHMRPPATGAFPGHIQKPHPVSTASVNTAAAALASIKTEVPGEGSGVLSSTPASGLNSEVSSGANSPSPSSLPVGTPTGDRAKLLSDKIKTDSPMMEQRRLSGGGVMKMALVKTIMPPSPPCYCGEEKPPSTLPMIQCTKCHKMFHQGCMETIRNWKFPPLLGDDFFHFICAICFNGKERLRRLTLSWSDVAHLTLFNLSHTVPPNPRATDGRLYYLMRKHITTFVDANWERFWLKPRPQTWSSSLASAMTSSDRFVSGKEVLPHEIGLWALSNVMTFPSMDEVSRRSRYAAYEINPDGTLREMQFLPGSTKPVDSNSATASPVDKKRKVEDNGKGGKSKKMKKDDISKKNAPLLPPGKKRPSNSSSKPKRPELRKIREVTPEQDVDMANSIMIYPDINNPPPPFNLRISSELTHADPKMKISEDGMTTSTDKGYRMAKTSHGIYEGKWYCEVTYKGENPARARIGWAQISGDLQAPCGFDIFGYSFRNDPGTLFHESKDYGTPNEYLEGFHDGDVIGMMIDLPPLEVEHQKALMRRIWVEGKPYVQFRTGPLPKLPGSEIRYFKNGKDLGVAFKDLYLGKYHVALSSYRGGSLTVNFGPDFTHTIPEGARPLRELETEYKWMDLISHYDGTLQTSPLLDSVFRPKATAQLAGASGGVKKKAARRVLNFPLATKKKKKKKKVVPAPDAVKEGEEEGKRSDLKDEERRAAEHDEALAEEEEELLFGKKYKKEENGDGEHGESGDGDDLGGVDALASVARLLMEASSSSGANGVESGAGSEYEDGEEDGEEEDGEEDGEDGEEGEDEGEEGEEGDEGEDGEDEEYEEAGDGEEMGSEIDYGEGEHDENGMYSSQHHEEGSVEDVDMVANGDVISEHDAKNLEAMEIEP
ncbi:transcription factor, contains a PHD finger motif [Phlyctochytrium planicorne]|nr:transcription factor, contains a PHD finger motif [Phlyctochytrium planicorne]